MKWNLASLLQLAVMSVALAVLQGCADEGSRVAVESGARLESLVESGRYRTVEDARRIAFEAVSMLDDVPHTYDDVVPGSLSKNMHVESMVLVFGTRVSEGISVGHMWLCDGVKHYKIRSRYYRSYDEGRTWRLVATDYLVERSYNMFNWGWDGGYNGYFLDK
ncbi:MAG: C10 family peptidase [Muribaculaceae bacterium]|jgi:hypothetical protein